jgi:smad nuclear-interacting protein 1
MSSRKRPRSPDPQNVIKRELSSAAIEPTAHNAVAALLASVPAEKAPVQHRHSRFGNQQTKSESTQAISPSRKQQINLSTSGALHEKETTTLNGTKLKYSEPADARAPTSSQCLSTLRLYVFKDGEPIQNEESILHLHRLSSYLLGRDEQVCDIPLLHASISKQHAVIQYRLKPQTASIDDDTETEFTRAIVKPYLIDLNSANGTKLNGERIESQRYYELLNKDIIQFGESTREYIVLIVDKKK